MVCFTLLLRITFTRCQPSSRPVRGTFDFKKIIALLGGSHSFFMVSRQYAGNRSFFAQITAKHDHWHNRSRGTTLPLHARCMLVAGACKMEAIALQKGGVSDHKPGAGIALKAPCATAKGCRLRNSLGINYTPV